MWKHQETRRNGSGHKWIQTAIFELPLGGNTSNPIFFLIVYITYFYLPQHSSAPIPVESWVNPKTDIPLYRSRLPQPIRWYTKEFCSCIWTFWNTNANMVSAIYNKKKTPGRHHTLFPLLQIHMYSFVANFISYCTYIYTYIHILCTTYALKQKFHKKSMEICW